ncbi:MAG: hypothetical protein V2A79_20185, partial [Planctomycetota bacterium]
MSANTLPEATRIVLRTLYDLLYVGLPHRTGGQPKPQHTVSDCLLAALLSNYQFDVRGQLRLLVDLGWIEDTGKQASVSRQWIAPDGRTVVAWANSRGMRVQTDGVEENLRWGGWTCYRPTPEGIRIVETERPPVPKVLDKLRKAIAEKGRDAKTDTILKAAKGIARQTARDGL